VRPTAFYIGLVAFAIGKRRERAANCRHYSAAAPDHLEGRTSSSILPPGTSTIREAATGAAEMLDEEARFDCEWYAVARRKAARWTARPGGGSSPPTQTGFRIGEGTS
jgi:hypothetical protein